MAINFPTSLDTFSNPTSTDLLENATAALDHDVQHSNANDAIEALEAKVGITSSAVTTSHDYKLGEVTGSDKAVGKTATQTLTNKTLTAPVINIGSDATGDIYYRSSGGLFSRLAIGTSGQILQVSSGGIPEWVTNPSAADGSTTVKGVYEEAAVSEVEGATATGGTGARLVLSTSNTPVRFLGGYALTTGGDTYAVTYSPVPTQYITGALYLFKADAGNTGTASLNVNSIGAKTIKKFANGSAVALSTGDISTGQTVVCMYDGTDMIMISAAQPRPLYACGQTTRAAASGTGTQNIAHGLGVIPRLIKIFSVARSTTNAETTYCYGTATGTGDETCTYGTHDTGDLTNQATGSIIYTVTSASSNGWAAEISALDATNITLNFTAATTPGTVYIQWEAYA